MNADLKQIPLNSRLFLKSVHPRKNPSRPFGKPPVYSSSHRTIFMERRKIHQRFSSSANRFLTRAATLGLSDIAIRYPRLNRFVSE